MDLATSYGGRTKTAHETLKPPFGIIPKGDILKSLPTAETTRVFERVIRRTAVRRSISPQQRLSRKCGSNAFKSNRFGRTGLQKNRMSLSQSDSVLKAVLEGLIYAVLTASKRLRATHFAVFCRPHHRVYSCQDRHRYILTQEKYGGEGIEASGH